MAQFSLLWASFLVSSTVSATWRVSSWPLTRAGGNRDSCSSEGYFEAEQADTGSVAVAQADVTSGLCFFACLQLSHKWSN